MTALKRVHVFLTLIGRRYDDLPGSFRISIGLAWELSGIMIR